MCQRPSMAIIALSFFYIDHLKIYSFKNLEIVLCIILKPTHLCFLKQIKYDSFLILYFSALFFDPSIMICHLVSDRQTTQTDILATLDPSVHDSLNFVVFNFQNKICFMASSSNQKRKSTCGKLIY